jgi:hypothetical protein
MIKLTEELGVLLLELGLRMVSSERLKQISIDKTAKAVQAVADSPLSGYLHEFDWSGAMMAGYSHERICDFLDGVTDEPELNHFFIDPTEGDTVH